jgi:pilus assembly protein CpaF
MATQFDKFIRRIIETAAEGDSAAGERRGALGINRLASIWVTGHGHSCAHSTSLDATIRPPPGRHRAPAPALRAAAVSRTAGNVHRKLLNRLNLEALARADRARAESEIRALMSQLLAEEPTPLNIGEREQLFAEVVDDVFGLGPPRAAPARPVGQRHPGEHGAERLRRAQGQDGTRHGVVPGQRAPDARDRPHRQPGRRRVDDSSPMVDARLPDGSRVNAIIPPLAVDGPLLSIRRFPAERLKANDLVTLGALTRRCSSSSRTASAPSSIA